MQTPQQKRNRWLLSEIERYAATGLGLLEWLLIVNIATRPQPVLIEDILMPGAMTRHAATVRTRLKPLESLGLVTIERGAGRPINNANVTVLLKVHITDLGRKLTGEPAA